MSDALLVFNHLFNPYPFTAVVRFRSQDSPYGIGGVKSGTGTDFSPTTLILHYHIHSACVPRLYFVHLPLTLYS